MNINEHTTPDALEKYSFLWSEVRMLIAALALLIGGVPPIFFITPPSLSGLVSSLLTLFWIISGAASVYLLYRWYSGGKTLFGKNISLDAAAFLVSIISGINLGLAGLTGSNIAMSILSNTFVFVVVAILYLLSAFYLFRRWKAFGNKIF